MRHALIGFPSSLHTSCVFSVGNRQMSVLQLLERFMILSPPQQLLSLYSHLYSCWLCVVSVKAEHRLTAIHETLMVPVKSPAHATRQKLVVLHVLNAMKLSDSAQVSLCMPEAAKGGEDIIFITSVIVLLHFNRVKSVNICMLQLTIAHRKCAKNTFVSSLYITDIYHFVLVIVVLLCYCTVV